MGLLPFYRVRNWTRSWGTPTDGVAGVLGRLLLVSLLGFAELGLLETWEVSGLRAAHTYGSLRPGP